MAIVYAQAAGVLAFFINTLVIGVRLRKTPTLEVAQRLSRVSHAFFWVGMMGPAYVGAVWPGLTRYDALLGLPSLPGPAIARWILGGLLLVAGVAFSTASMRALKVLGAGAMAFKLTKQIVSGAVYERVRNPMSLGMYLQFVGLSVVVGSTFLLLASVLVYIPAHAFNLKFFEELELHARHGASYDAYRERVPFLIPRLHAR
jgi:protein-S-isoprenylcysteine O-methyltransferase Ste14